MLFTVPFLPILALVGIAKAFTGDATYFYPGLGACGQINHKNDFIVAISAAQYDKDSHCFKKIKAQYCGKTVEAQVVDRCAGCHPDVIDLSPAAFSQLANLTVGRLHGVEWEYLTSPTPRVEN